MKKLFSYIITFSLGFAIVLFIAKILDIDWQAALIMFGFGVLYTLIISIMSMDVNNEN